MYITEKLICQGLPSHECHFKPPMLPHVLTQAPHVLNTCRKPYIYIYLYIYIYIYICSCQIIYSCQDPFNKSNYVSIVHKGVPVPSFRKAPTSWSSLSPTPLYEIFLSPFLFSVPSTLFQVFQTLTPTFKQPPPAIIWHTNLSYT